MEYSEYEKAFSPTRQPYRLWRCYFVISRHYSFSFACGEREVRNETDK